MAPADRAIAIGFGHNWQGFAGCRCPRCHPRQNCIFDMTNKGVKSGVARPKSRRNGRARRAAVLWEPDGTEFLPPMSHGRRLPRPVIRTTLNSQEKPMTQRLNPYSGNYL